MPWKNDATVLGWLIGLILTLFTSLLGLLKYIWNGHLKEVNKSMHAQAERINENDERLDVLERSVPLQIAELKTFAKDEFTSRDEFREKIKHIEDTSTERFNDLKTDNNEIKDILTQMRTDIITRQEKEIIEKDRRIAELIDGKSRG